MLPAEDFVSWLEVPHVFADRFDHAAKIGAKPRVPGFEKSTAQARKK